MFRWQTTLHLHVLAFVLLDIFLVILFFFCKSQKLFAVNLYLDLMSCSMSCPPKMCSYIYIWWSFCRKLFYRLLVELDNIYTLNIIIHRWKEKNVATLRNYATLRWSKETKRRRRTRIRVEKWTITSHLPCCHISFTRQFWFFIQPADIDFLIKRCDAIEFLLFICNSLLIIIFDSRHFCQFAAFDIIKLKSGERIFMAHNLLSIFLSLSPCGTVHCFSFFDLSTVSLCSFLFSLVNRWMKNASMVHFI